MKRLLSTVAILVSGIVFITSCKKDASTPVNTSSNSSNTPSTTFWTPFSYAGSVQSFTINTNGIWFVGTDAGLIVSNNQGTSFTTYSYPGLPTSNVNTVRAGISGEVYELMNDGTLLRSDNNGQSYVNIGSNINSSTVSYIKFRSIDVMPNGDIWCGVFVSVSSGSGSIGINEEGLAKSSDKGKTWTFPAGLKAGNSAVNKVTADSKGNLYCIVSNSSVAKSSDGGKTWSYIYPSSGIYVVNDLEVNSKDQLMIAGDHGLGVSNNAGASFQSVSLPSELSSSYLENAIASPKGNFFITTKTTLVDHSAETKSNCYYTTDNGSTWVNIRNVPSARVIWLQGFDSKGYLLGKYATATGTGICVSTTTF